MKRLFPVHAILLVLAVMLASGCALTTANLDLSYKPEPGSKSPLSTIKPVTFLLQVEDKRVAAEQGRVGDKRNGFGAVTAPILSNVPPKDILYAALKTELVDSGHLVVDANADSSDAILTVDLNRYWCDSRIHFWDIEVIGILNTDIVLRKPKDDTILFSQPHNCTFRESRQIATESVFESVLNGALSDFVRGLSRDPGFLDGLRKADKAVGTGEKP
jgi:hypothetical protein